MMQYLIPMAAILIVAGSFMWFRPSARDQYLTKLRAEALRSGYRLGTMKLPDFTEFGIVNGGDQLVTVYLKSMTFLKADEPLVFTVARTEGESGIFLPDGWNWVERGELTKPMRAALSDFLLSLPDCVRAVTVNNQQVGICWNERAGAITLSELSIKLEQLATVINRRLNGSEFSNQ